MPRTNYSLKISLSRSNSFQALLVTGGTKSYCLFVYRCGLLGSPEEGHPLPKVLGKYCFSQKLLTGQLSTAHGYPSASPTKRDNTPFKKTARSEAVVAEVLASRSGRERRHTPLWWVVPFRGPAPIPTSLF